MRVLVLGGTNFIGPHVVAALLRGGHDVTVFNRGKSSDELPAVVTRLRGDRTTDDLDALRGLTFDATVDMCGFFPRAVTAIFDAIADPGYYCFISTLSVYASFADEGQDESAPVAVLEDDSVEEITDGAYGGLKVLCERVVRERANAHAILRLGLVVGPGDATDRFSYWPVRVAAGGAMLVPGKPSDPLQWIDARDVADFARRCVERGTEGTFNVVTAPCAHTLGALIATCQEAADVQVSQVWIGAAELERHGLVPWTDFPCWFPSDGENAGFATFSNAAAMTEGLSTRPAVFTVKDLLDWWGEQPRERRHLRAGLDGEREGKILDKILERSPIVLLARHPAEPSVRAAVAEAFGRDDEYLLIEALRRSPTETLEVSASCGGTVVGHVMMSRLDVSANGLVAWALAPMAVRTDWQGRGIGQLLGGVAIEACRARAADLICVLGHPEYYPRLGFSASVGAQVASEYSSAGPAWMALELKPGAAERIGEVRFAAPFGELGDEG